MVIGNLDESKGIDEIVKTIVYFHQTLDEKKEELTDAMENIRDFYADIEIVTADDFDLEGNPVKIKVLKPLSRDNQKIMNDSMVEISRQIAAVYIVSMNMKQKLHQLGTDRVMANTQIQPTQPEGESLADKAKKLVLPNFVAKKEKEYTSLNELDDPFKLSKNQIQEAENYAKIYDEYVDFHHWGIDLAEETDISGQRWALNLIINFFNSRVQGKILRLIEEADRIQLDAERIDAIKVMTEANKQNMRQRNVMGGMMPPQN